jgi:hypothetical protein
MPPETWLESKWLLIYNILQVESRVQYERRSLVWGQEPLHQEWEVELEQSPATFPVSIIPESILATRRS